MQAEAEQVVEVVGVVEVVDEGKHMVEGVVREQVVDKQEEIPLKIIQLFLPLHA